MTKFQTLSTTKLEKVLGEIREYFYKKEKVNIVVNNSVAKKQYKSFRKKTKIALEKQIGTFTKEKTIDSILNEVSKVDDDALFIAIASAMIVFYKAFPGGRSEAEKYLSWVALLGGQDALAKIGAKDVKFTVGKESKKIIEQRLDFLLEQLDKTTTSWIAGTISTGLKNNLSTKDISEIIKGNMSRIATNRAEIITETELTSMIGAITLEVFEKNNIKNHRWITVKDERACKVCTGNERDGWIKVGNKFSSGVKFVPGHISCRCFLEPKEKKNEEIWRG